MRTTRLFFGLVLLGALSVHGAAAADEAPLPFRLPGDHRSLPVTALIETTKGPFEIKFHRREAPVSVANFEYVSKMGMYQGVEFHRYVPAMLVQGGDPTGTKRGGPRWTLPPEITDTLRHARGSVGWARLDEKLNPERRSNASQFYITLRPVPGLDGFYTIFAEVIRGMENVDQLRPGDKIISVRFPKRDGAAGDGAARQDEPAPSSGEQP